MIAGCGSNPCDRPLGNCRAHQLSHDSSPGQTYAGLEKLGGKKSRDGGESQI